MTSNTNTNTERPMIAWNLDLSKIKIHPFEAAGLGRFPFRFTGCETKTYQACHGAPVQPGGSCHLCGTALYTLFHIKDVDGKRFYVGSDCIGKLHKDGAMGLTPEDRRLCQDIAAAARKVQNEKRHAREAVKLAHLEVLLDREDVQTYLRARPSGNEWGARNGQTEWDQIGNRYRASGTSGRLSILTYVLTIPGVPQA